jgi:hypothetical protein
VPAAIGAVVLAPHLAHDLQRLFEAFEPLRQGRKGNSERGVLTFVPGGSETEDRTATRQHVQGGHDLRQQARVPVRHAGDQQLQLDGAGLPGEVAEGRVALQHGSMDVAQSGHLQVMVHQ